MENLNIHKRVDIDILTLRSNEQSARIGKDLDYIPDSLFIFLFHCVISYSTTMVK